MIEIKHYRPFRPSANEPERCGGMTLAVLDGSVAYTICLPQDQFDPAIGAEIAQMRLRQAFGHGSDIRITHLRFVEFARAVWSIQLAEWRRLLGICPFDACHFREWVSPPPESTRPFPAQPQWRYVQRGPNPGGNIERGPNPGDTVWDGMQWRAWSALDGAHIWWVREPVIPRPTLPPEQAQRWEIVGWAKPDPTKHAGWLSALLDTRSGDEIGVFEFRCGNGELLDAKLYGGWRWCVREKPPAHTSRAYSGESSMSAAT